MTVVKVVIAVTEVIVVTVVHVVSSGLPNHKTEQEEVAYSRNSSNINDTTVVVRLETVGSISTVVTVSQQLSVR